MAQGRLYIQDLNQFAGRGIPIIEELADQFKVAESEVRGLVEAGKVGFPEVRKVIEDLTNEGGKFGGLMEAQSRTITGQIRNMEDAIEMMFNDIGKSGEGMINTALSALSAGTDEYNAVKDKIVKQFGKYYDGLDEEITKVGLTEAAYGRLTEAIKKSFSARQYEKFAKEQGDALESAVADNLRKIQDRLYKELGDEKGSETYTKIRDGILQGTIGPGKGMHGLTGISKELQESLDKAAGVEGGIDFVNRSVEAYIRKILKAKELAEETDRKARERFGIDEDPMAGRDRPDGVGRGEEAGADKPRL